MNTNTADTGTIKITRSVCRVGIGHRDIQITVPIGATDAAIRAMVLEEAANHEFAEHDAEYELTDSQGDEQGKLKTALVGLLQGLADLGFGTNLPIGIDAIDSVQQLFTDFLDRSAGPLAVDAWVIHSESENGFWIQDFGWGHGDDAKVYFEKPQLLSMTADARLIPYALKSTFGHVVPEGMDGMSLKDAIDQADDPGADVNSLRAAAEVLEEIEDPTHKDIEALRIIRAAIAAA